MTTMIFQKDGVDITEGIELENWGFMAYKVWHVWPVRDGGVELTDRELLGTLYAGFVEKLEPGVTVREQQTDTLTGEKT